jgi:DNA-directed RNA polymerase specialized sigma24 family protein
MVGVWRCYMDDQTSQEIEALRYKKKQFLRRYRKNVACIERLEKKLVLLDERITSLKSPSLSGMPRGGVPVTIDDLMSDKMDLEDRIKRLKAKSRDLKKTVYEEIDSLEDSRYCEVLEAYFIEGLSFEDIAEEMGYTERHVINLYSEAITFLTLTVQ